MPKAPVRLAGGQSHPSAGGRHHSARHPARHDPSLSPLSSQGVATTWASRSSLCGPAARFVPAATGAAPDPRARGMSWGRHRDSRAGTHRPASRPPSRHDPASLATLAPRCASLSPPSPGHPDWSTSPGNRSPPRTHPARYLRGLPSAVARASSAWMARRILW